MKKFFRNHSPFLLWSATTILLYAAAPLASSQEESVKPGINDSFQDPDVREFIDRFEGDGRAIYAKRQEVLATLGLKPGDEVADIGAGTGFFSMMMGKAVGDSGTVYAVDIAQNFLDHIVETAGEKGLKNVRPVLCDQKSTKLEPNSIDAAFICDVYHHFEFPFLTMASLHQAIRTGGTLVVVDFERIVGITGQFFMDHMRAGKGTFTDEIIDSGFELVEEIDLFEEQYVLRFRKREMASER
ncbi:MAG: methyltransferase domain-containing protein [Candidatus Hydrogenedentes bacterium]|jgi:ubiquinone/menaquinone biosynthesis C-methylase UbiE|nr:methyltransferase domain-containing protein [Candidatus Hydrogenedentota bacterium]